MPTSDIELRPARPEDAPAIAAIWHLGWRDGHLGNVPVELTAARQEDSFRTRAGRRIGDTTVAVVATGWLLGGTLGVVTLLYAVTIGPLVHVLLPRLEIAPPAVRATGPPRPPGGRR